MIKALIYCRVLVAEQGEPALSIDVQEAALIHEAERRGYAYEVVRDDSPAGLNAASQDKLSEALDLLDAHEAHVLMAVRLESLVQVGGDASSILRRSEEKGWGIVLSGDRLGGSAGVARASSIGVEIAQQARKSRSDRTREGMARRKAEGAILGRTVDPTFMATYREVLAMVARGMSYNSVARALNEQNIATSKGGKWYASTIKAMVESETAKRLGDRDAG